MNDGVFTLCDIENLVEICWYLFLCNENTSTQFYASDVLLVSVLFLMLGSMNTVSALQSCLKRLKYRSSENPLI